MKSQTYRVRFDTSIAHLPSQVRIDGNDKCLHQDTTIERYVLELNSLTRVVNCRLTRDRETCQNRVSSAFEVGRKHTGWDLVENDRRVLDGRHDNVVLCHPRKPHRAAFIVADARTSDQHRW